jgi:hypothetical protein
MFATRNNEIFHWGTQSSTLQQGEGIYRSSGDKYSLWHVGAPEYLSRKKKKRTSGQE